MIRDREDEGAFLERYNSELARLGCGARITTAESGDPSMMSIVDLDGSPVADLPMSLDPAALSAVMALVERSFEEGVRTGRAIAVQEAPPPS